jgi:hypothetical protein
MNNESQVPARADCRNHIGTESRSRNSYERGLCLRSPGRSRVIIHHVHSRCFEEAPSKGPMSPGIPKGLIHLLFFAV